LAPSSLWITPESRNQYRLLAEGLLLEFNSPNPIKAAKVYYNLYRSTHSLPYLEKGVRLLLASREYKLAEEWSRGIWEPTILKLHIEALLFQDKFEEAERFKGVIGPLQFYPLLLSYLGSRGEWERFTFYSRKFYRETGSEVGLRYLITGLIETDQIGEAQELLEQFLKTHPHNLFALTRLEQIYRDLMEEEKLLQLYRHHPTPSNVIKGVKLLLKEGRFAEARRWIELYKLPLIWQIRLAFEEGKWKKGLKLVEEGERAGIPHHGEEWEFYKLFFRYKLTHSPALLKKLAQMGVVESRREFGVPITIELIKQGALRQGEEVVGSLLMETGQFDWGKALMGWIKMKEGECEEARYYVQDIYNPDDPKLSALVEKIKKCGKERSGDIAKNP